MCVWWAPSSSSSDTMSSLKKSITRSSKEEARLWHCEWIVNFFSSRLSLSPYDEWSHPLKLTMTVTEFIRSKMSCEIYFHVDDDASARATHIRVDINVKPTGGLISLICVVRGGKKKYATQHSQLSAVLCVFTTQRTKGNDKNWMFLRFSQHDLEGLASRLSRSLLSTCRSYAVFLFRIFLFFSLISMIKRFFICAYLTRKNSLILPLLLRYTSFRCYLLFVVFSSMKHRNFSSAQLYAPFPLRYHHHHPFSLSLHSSHPRSTSQ